MNKKDSWLYKIFKKVYNWMNANPNESNYNNQNFNKLIDES